MSQKRNKTIFQNLTSILMGNIEHQASKKISSYNIPSDSNIIFKTGDKDEYEKQLMQAKQRRLLAYQWKKAGVDNASESLAGLTNVKLMYRDSDLMDGWPEIGAALDIVAEESCTVSSKGKMINIYSSSDRIKSVLEDLFVNRLDSHIMLPMICRAMCKYGNNFMLLNIDDKNGILGWRQLPVYEIERIENGIENPYIAASAVNQMYNLAPNETKFIWVGHNESLPYKSWQVAHFRLLTDSIFLPYGVSWLHKARRHWRMLSMMEDMMLIYRLERSIERRVFKIYVGAIDDSDVQAYVNEVANNMKRTPIIDPQTGQLDLRKNFMDMTSDYFIPVRSENAANPIETLNGAQNLTAMDDIEYMQNKVLSALRIPKTFLNFQDAQGKGQNLSLLDIRFSRTVNRIQQALLMELNKIAIIHLYILGFHDDLTNFTLSMNNPSSQSEMLEIENLQKRITTAQSALSDPGNGIPILSWHRALKEVLKMDDKEIADNLEEIRLERALAAELEKTAQIIKRTGIFDPVDRIYGEPNAEYTEDNTEGNGDSSGPIGGGGGFGGGFGDSLGDLGEPGSDETGDITGNEGETGLENAPEIENGGPEPNPAPEQTAESFNPIRKNKKLITEANAKVSLNRLDDIYEKYRNKILGEASSLNELKYKNGEDESHGFKRVSLSEKNFLINQEINETCSEIDEFINKDND